jgi:uncharacterized membrane protein
MMSWRARWRTYEYVRNSLWIVPALFGVTAIAAGIVLPNLDERTTTTIGIEFGDSAAQGMLGAMAGGMITFTGFVFSILLLAVQFGSSQFSPRMLRRFLRDPTTKVSLGVFMATFIYALLVLRTIDPADNENFVPDNSISIALMMLLLSMALFLRLISRTTGGLRVAAVLAELGRDGTRIVRRIYPDPAPAEPAPPAPQPPAGPAHLVTFEEQPGVLQSIDIHGLVRLATEADAVVELVPPLGDLLGPGDPLFRIHGVDGGSGAGIDDERLRRSVATGDERTMRQDPAFIFRLLADISSKALSPGVNDPTTAAQALDQIELLLKQLAGRRLESGRLRDDSGTVRLIHQAPSWQDFLSIALDETRIFGAGSVQVTRRLRALLDDLLAVAPPYRRPAVEAQLALLDASVGRSYAEVTERALAGAPDRQGIGSPRDGVAEGSAPPG